MSPVSNPTRFPIHESRDTLEHIPMHTRISHSLRFTTRRMAGFLFLLAAAACGDSGTNARPGEPTPGPDPVDPVPTPTPVVSVEVSPGFTDVMAGQTVQMGAVTRAADGAELARPVVWTSVNPGVASVDAQGKVTAHEAGWTHVTATSEGRSATALITVLAPPAPVAYVQVQPHNVTLEVGSGRELAARPFAANGSQLMNRVITWASSDSTVVSVDAQGRVFALKGGTATITATSEGRTGAATVSVPLWREYTLKRAGGVALPAQLSSETYTDDGGAQRTVRVVATAGAFRFSTTDNRWEQRLTLETYEGGVLKGVQVFGDRGTVEHEMLGVRLVSTLYANRSAYTAGPWGDQWTITQKAGLEGPDVTFVYEKK
jgi:Bacterial Ig-like domain (group 2)